MKKVIALIVFASFVIAACMVYLLKSGISLSPAVLIKPSHFSSQEQIADGVVRRLFPQLNENSQWQTKTPTAGLLSSILDVIRAQHPRVTIEAQNLDPEIQLESGERPTLYVHVFPTSDFSLSKECEAMKRLNYKCFVEISLHKSRRKMKSDGKKYFLMTSYLERHYLVLVEEERADNNAL